MDLVVLFLFQFLTFSESSLLPELLDTVSNLPDVLQNILIPESLKEKCAKIEGFYCEADQKCYTSSKGPAPFEKATQTCGTYNTTMFVGSLPKFEDLNNPETLECLQNSVPFQPYISYWFEDSLAVGGKCKVLEFSNQRASLKVHLLTRSRCPGGGSIRFFCTLSAI
ncbi:UNVERIFIED_CONTAM: hypothetical protein RMT77_006799 [Armadillidium vulgare]